MIVSDFERENNPEFFKNREEEKSLLTYFSENERLEFQDIWQATGLLSKNKTYNATLAWKNLKPHFHQGSSKKRILPIMRIMYRIAALLIIGLILGLLSYHVFHQDNAGVPLNQFSYYVPYGSKSSLLLPDSTLVWLNAGSRIEYSQDFNHTYRDIQLEGEAFFEVSPNKEKPFRVWAKYSMIQVVGTSFNVKAYNDEESLETTVVEGLVKVFPDNDAITQKKSIQLKAHQQVNISDNYASKKLSNTESLSEIKQKSEQKEYTGINLVENIETEKVISWKNDTWIIESETLKEIAVKMERRFNVIINLEGEEIEAYVFSGVIKEESLEQMLMVISATSPVNFRLDKQTVYIFKEKKAAKKNKG